MENVRSHFVADMAKLMHGPTVTFCEVRSFEIRHRSRLASGNDDPNLRRIGNYYVFQMRYALEGYTLRLFTKTLGWSKEDTDALISRVQEELQQEDLQLYSNFHLNMGQKPAHSGRK